MNVMRPHPTHNRGKGRTLRKSHTDLNIFQTVRVGTKNLLRPGHGGSFYSGQAIGSSTLSRHQWSNQRSTTLSSSDFPSVARILMSEAEDSLWTSGIEASRKSTFGETSAEPNNPICELDRHFLPSTENVENRVFFEDILNNSKRDETDELNTNLADGDNDAVEDVEMPFPSIAGMAQNQDECAFFTLEQVLQTDSVPANHNVQSGVPIDEPDRQPPINDAYDFFFKTPILPPKDNSSSRLDNDYESIFETPMRVRELPKLSTPLYHSKVR